jgi:hypothetical protein
MRAIFVFAVAVALPGLAVAAEPPLAERYLHSGLLERGQSRLKSALADEPRNDQLRFGLGFVEFMQAIEFLGQSLYKYGAKAENTTVPFLRLPVPKNPKPETISYELLGQVFDDFLEKLARAEKTLADITDEKVKLPLRLAKMRLDLDGDGQPTDEFSVILKRMTQQNFAFLKDNPEFLVNFDRGDVAWLRAYCHLLSAMLEGYRSVDLEAEFEDRVGDVFPKVKLIKKKAEAPRNVLVFSRPARLGNARKHLLAVAELNRETWKFIRAETDDDHEWLPHSKQKGVLGLPVSNEMIDTWLAMMDQLEGLMNGSRVISSMYFPFLGMKGETEKHGLSLQKLLDQPPKQLDFTALNGMAIPAKYLSPETDKNQFDIQVIVNVYRLFDNPLGMGYMAWFN